MRSFAATNSLTAAMQASVWSQGSSCWTFLGCPQNVRPVPCQRHAHNSSALSTLPSSLRSKSQSQNLRVVLSAQQEDFAVTETEVEYVPSVLKLPIESRGVDGVASSLQDGSNSDSTDGVGDLIQTGTTKEVFEAVTKAVADAPIQSVGQVALYSGMTAFGLLIVAAVMNSVELVPFIPEALETAGVVYSILIASQILLKNAVSFPPPSPFKAVVELVDSGQSQAGTVGLNNFQEVSKGVATVLERVAKEKDIALNEAELKKASEKIASVLAEKEALEAVTLQLADERDGTMSEVSVLKDAMVAMTNRIRGIDEMLEQEVSQLKQQNEALETVSSQLAAKRDAAVQEVEQLRIRTGEDASEAQKEETEALEVVSIQLAQEWDEALADIEELKKVVAILREAIDTSSGLALEQEVFIKARVRDIRSQFIDQERTYDDQKEQVDKFVDHLVEDCGARRDWVSDHIMQFLHSSATKPSLPTLSNGSSQVENLKTQTTRSL